MKVLIKYIIIAKYEQNIYTFQINKNIFCFSLKSHSSVVVVKRVLRQPDGTSFKLLRSQKKNTGGGVVQYRTPSNTTTSLFALF